MLKRTFAFLLVLFIGSLLVAPITAQEETTLVVASFYPVDQTAGWAGLVADFEAEHPGVTIETQVTPFDEYLARLLTQVAGGDPPDVVGVENGPFPQFVERGILADVTDLLAASDGFAAADFFPHLLDRYTYDGRVYGIPYDAQPFAMLFYNPALFDAAGVEYPTNDWNWDDWLAAAEALTIRDESGNVTQYGMDVGSTWTYFLYGAGGAMVDDLRNPTMSMLDSPESIEGIQFMVDLMHTHEVYPSPQTLEALGGATTEFFLNGKTAMFIGGFWNAVFNPQGFSDLGARIVMGPVKDTSNRIYPTGGTAYTVMESSEHKDLAWEFVVHFMGPAGYEAAYEAATLGSIYPPAHIPSYEWYLAQPIEFLDTIQPNQDALEFVRFSPYRLDWGEIQARCIDPEMDLILRGEIPVEETLVSMSECVNSRLN